MTTETTSQLPPCPLPDCEGGEHHFHDIYAYTIGDGHDCAKVARIDYRCYGPHRPGLSEPIDLPEITDEMVEAATPGPWVAEIERLNAKVGRLVAVHASYFDLDGRPGYDDTNPEPEDVWRFDRDFRAALPDPLDALDVAEGHRDSLAATLIEVQREKLALGRAIERVRALHYAADNDSPRTPVCEECQGRAGAHPCGCWAEVDREPVCGHCNAVGRGQRVPWPCPTIQALDGGESA